MSSREAAETSGRIAEFFAVIVLLCSGHRILARRWRCHAGEVDIIAKRRNLLLFIEVKYRRRMDHWHGISPRQKQRITRAAQTFAANHRISRKFEWRFDVILIQTDVRAWPHMWQHIKDAWQAELR